MTHIGSAVYHFRKRPVHCWGPVSSFALVIKQALETKRLLKAPGPGNRLAPPTRLDPQVRSNRRRTLLWSTATRDRGRSSRATRHPPSQKRVSPVQTRYVPGIPGVS